MSSPLWPCSTGCAPRQALAVGGGLDPGVLNGGVIPVMDSKFTYKAPHQMHLSSVLIIDAVNRTIAPKSETRRSDT